VGRSGFDKSIFIRSSRDFDRIFKNGNKISSEHILVLYLQSDTIKIGFTVSKKIKGAVHRNRAKRRLKEVVRLNQNLLPRNRAYIFLAKPGMERFEFKKVEKELVHLIAKIRQQRTS
jgi:ribonuclease P protein component